MYINTIRLGHSLQQPQILARHLFTSYGTYLLLYMTEIIVKNIHIKYYFNYYTLKQ